MSSQYPRDEFDLAGEDMPVGMHRPQPSRWKSVWPFLALLVIVPLLAWGASALLTHQSAPTASTSTQSAPASGATPAPAQSAESAAPQSAPAPPPAPAEAAQSNAAQSEPVQEIDHNVKISVLNGTGTTGLAAQKVAQLAQAGFPGASAANASNWASEVSAVYYQDPALKASAEAVGAALGISNVQRATDIGDPDVVVLLR